MYQRFSGQTVEAKDNGEQLQTDLLQRLNGVVELNASLEETISNHQNQVFKQQKKYVDLKVKCSQLRDEMQMQNEQV